MDARTRRRERAAEDSLGVIRDRLRTGDLRRESLALAARLGHRDALEIEGEAEPFDFADRMSTTECLAGCSPRALRGFALLFVSGNSAPVVELLLKIEDASPGVLVDGATDAARWWIGCSVNLSGDREWLKSELARLVLTHDGAVDSEEA